MKPIVSTLNHFRNKLSRLIHAWEDFDRRQLRFLEPDGKELLRNRWQGYLDTAQDQVSELNYLRMLVSQELESFNSTRTGVSDLNLSDHYDSC